MRNKILVMVVATALSGYISGYNLLFNNAGIAAWQLKYGPGIFFGLTTAVIFFWAYKTPIWKLALWLGSSVLAWYAALKLYLHFIGYTKDGMTGNGVGLNGWQMLVVTGILGATILAIAHLVLIQIQKKNIKAPLVIIVAGAIGGCLMYWVPKLIPGNESLGSEDSSESSFRLVYAVMFAAWQATVGLALAIWFGSQEKTASTQVK